MVVEDFDEEGERVARLKPKKKKKKKKEKRTVTYDASPRRDRRRKRRREVTSARSESPPKRTKLKKRQREEADRERRGKEREKSRREERSEEVTPPKPRQKKRRKVEYVPSKEDEQKEKEFASLKSLVKKFNSKREKPSTPMSPGEDERWDPDGKPTKTKKATMDLYNDLEVDSYKKKSEEESSSKTEKKSDDVHRDRKKKRRDSIQRYRPRSTPLNPNPANLTNYLTPGQAKVGADLWEGPTEVPEPEPTPPKKSKLIRKSKTKIQTIKFNIRRQKKEEEKPPSPLFWEAPEPKKEEPPPKKIDKKDLQVTDLSDNKALVGYLKEMNQMGKKNEPEVKPEVGTIIPQAHSAPMITGTLAKQKAKPAMSITGGSLPVISQSLQQVLSPTRMTPAGWTVVSPVQQQILKQQQLLQLQRQQLLMRQIQQQTNVVQGVVSPQQFVASGLTSAVVSPTPASDDFQGPPPNQQSTTQQPQATPQITQPTLTQPATQPALAQSAPQMTQPALAQAASQMAQPTLAQSASQMAQPTLQSTPQMSQYPPQSQPMNQYPPPEPNAPQMMKQYPPPEETQPAPEFQQTQVQQFQQPQVQQFQQSQVQQFQQPQVQQFQQPQVQQFQQPQVQQFQQPQVQQFQQPPPPMSQFPPQNQFQQSQQFQQPQVQQFQQPPPPLSTGFPPQQQFPPQFGQSVISSPRVSMQQRLLGVSQMMPQVGTLPMQMIPVSSPMQQNIPPPAANIFMQNGHIINTQVNQLPPQPPPPAQIEEGRRRRERSRSRSRGRRRSYSRSRSYERRRRSRSRSHSRERRRSRRFRPSRSPAPRSNRRPKGRGFDRAWLKGEIAPNREEFPLAIAAESAQFSDWQIVMQNEEKRSFSAKRNNPFKEERLQELWKLAKENLPWSRPKIDGKPLHRSAAFMVAPGCKCKYRYSGTRWEPHEFPKWFQDLTDEVMSFLGIDLPSPNSCNVNLYDDGTESVGWHSDNEPIFESQVQDCLIVSMSLGATRDFQIQQQWADGRKIETVSLCNGDLMTMEGLFQRYYSHRVPRSSCQKPRINFTWRYITSHELGCPRREESNPIHPHNFQEYFRRKKAERMAKERGR